MWNRSVLSAGILFLLLTGLSGQTSYLNNPYLLARADSCLWYIYNQSIPDALRLQKEIAVRGPDHPAPDFLMGLIIYWNNFPLTPDNDHTEEFIHHMDRAIELADKMIPDEKLHIEGVFFDLFGRAFKAMFWADNGKPLKIVPDLRTMHQYTVEGFKLMYQFNEFYFSTGLYNYYIEAYPEAHPVYKPLVSFMEPGNKKLGLKQLKYAINHTVFLKVEAILFMSLIQLNYEKDINTAALYAEKLVSRYPGNIYYRGHYITILLHQHQYDKVRKLLKEIHEKSEYATVITSMANGFLLEKEISNNSEAKNAYNQCIRSCESIGPFADIYKAIAFMGLSRIAGDEGNSRDGNRYQRQAERLTNYEFILSE